MALRLDVVKHVQNPAAVLPAQDQEFVTWAGAAGVKLDSLRVATFDGALPRGGSGTSCLSAPVRARGICSAIDQPRIGSPPSCDAN